MDFHSWFKEIYDVADNITDTKFNEKAKCTGVGKKQSKQTKQTKQTTWLNMISMLHAS